MPSTTPSCTSSRKRTRTRFPAISDRASHSSLTGANPAAGRSHTTVPAARRAKQATSSRECSRPVSSRSDVAVSRWPGSKSALRMFTFRPIPTITARDRPGRRHLRQDAADLPAPDPDIIRPFDPHARGTDRGHRLRNRHPRQKGDLRGSGGATAGRRMTER